MSTCRYLCKISLNLHLYEYSGYVGGTGVEIRAVYVMVYILWMAAIWVLTMNVKNRQISQWRWVMTRLYTALKTIADDKIRVRRFTNELCWAQCRRQVWAKIKNVILMISRKKSRWNESFFPEHASSLNVDWCWKIRGYRERERYIAKKRLYFI